MNIFKRVTAFFKRPEEPTVYLSIHDNRLREARYPGYKRYEIKQSLLFGATDETFNFANSKEIQWPTCNTGYRFKAEWIGVSINPEEPKDPAEKKADIHIWLDLERPLEIRSGIAPLAQPGALKFTPR